MPRSDRNAVNVSGETKTKVEQIASQEERSVAQMVRILLNEAIAAREDTQEASLRDVLKLIRTFDVPTLAKVIEESVRLILQRSSTPETTAVATFMRGWDMEKACPSFWHSNRKA
jgi:predicted transcriptional regulator